MFYKTYFNSATIQISEISFSPFTAIASVLPVSYTHLDVYKRQHKTNWINIHNYKEKE